ncbi:Hypothetical predicted protein [Mytilus galloprovincialis]|uniref:Uncharacterized protein n=1 Tax=Mytilus galloprovincialis TaxID=29158 RepID=A0A8B6E9M0_MYTGA|nr:Hypothetical predicted protein [Mytilus galloprovincialis]
MSEAPDLTIELFELLTKIDNRLTVIEARTDRIENIETALGQLTRKVDTMKSDIIELKTKTTDLEKNADFISNKYEELRGENSAQDNKIRQLQKDKQSPGEQKTQQSTSLSGTPPTDNRKSQKRARHGSEAES